MNNHETKKQLLKQYNFITEKLVRLKFEGSSIPKEGEYFITPIKMGTIPKNWLVKILAVIKANGDILLCMAPVIPKDLQYLSSEEAESELLKAVGVHDKSFASMVKAKKSKYVDPSELDLFGTIRIHSYYSIFKNDIEFRNDPIPFRITANTVLLKMWRLYYEDIVFNIRINGNKSFSRKLEKGITRQFIPRLEKYFKSRKLKIKHRFPFRNDVYEGTSTAIIKKYVASKYLSLEYC